MKTFIICNIVGLSVVVVLVTIAFCVFRHIIKMKNKEICKRDDKIIELQEQVNYYKSDCEWRTKLDEQD